MKKIIIGQQNIELIFKRLLCLKYFCRVYKGTGKGSIREWSVIRTKNCAIILLFLFFSGVKLSGRESKVKRPNVVWILIENIGPELPCYGNNEIKTPYLDRLAADGTIYRNAFANAPVCSPSRSSLITGLYPNAFGAHPHRSKGNLPDTIRTRAELFRAAGYYTTLGNGYVDKTDYNISTEGRILWDGKDWSGRKESQTFFAQLTINHTHKGMHWHNPYDPKSWMHEKYREVLEPVNPAKIKLPKIIPDKIYTRDDWAKYLEQIQVADYHVGKVIERLKNEGLYDNTLIVVMGDIGRDHLRNIYWLYDRGLQIPLIVKRSGEETSYTVSDQLLSRVDVSASLLKACKIRVPSYIQGIPFLGSNSKKREYVYSSRDRMDYAYDMVCSIRGPRFRYIRNFMPERPYNQHRSWLTTVNPGYPLINYMADTEPGALNEVQRQYTAGKKPKEELYDIVGDPDQFNNLSEDPDYHLELQKYRALLSEWMLAIDDKARIMETRGDVREVTFRGKIVFPYPEEQYTTAMINHIRDPEEKYYLILMAGQSNVVGQGQKKVLSSTTLPPNFQYFNFGMTLDFKIHREAFGPEVRLSAILSEEFPEREFVVLKYAIGGASKLDWASDYNAKQAEITGHPEFGNMYRKFLKKIEAIKRKYNPEIVGLLWIQGEKDARIPEAGAHYFENFKTWIRAIRSDLNSPDLPILVGKINPPQLEYPLVAEIRTVQEAVSAELVDVYIIDTEGLDKNSDRVHYSSEGQMELGRRNGEKLKEFLAEKIKVK